MGLFENLFKKQKIEHGVNGYFKSLTAYSPCFTTFEGGVYEMELAPSPRIVPNSSRKSKGLEIRR